MKETMQMNENSKNNNRIDITVIVFLIALFI